MPANFFDVSVELSKRFESDPIVNAFLEASRIRVGVAPDDPWGLRVHREDRYLRRRLSIFAP